MPRAFIGVLQVGMTNIYRRDAGSVKYWIRNRLQQMAQVSPGPCTFLPATTKPLSPAVCPTRTHCSPFRQP